MLNEGYRRRYAHYSMLASIMSIPRMEAEKAGEFIRNLDWASKHPSDILDTSGEGSSQTDLKKFFGKT